MCKEGIYMPPVKARAVLCAADILGGIERLAAHLNARSDDIESWLADRVPLPEHIYQQCVEIVVDSLLGEAGAGHARNRGSLH